MIQCEKCGSDRTEQSDTRQRPNTLYVWRRRTCKSCGYKFTTREHRVSDLTKLNMIEEKIKKGEHDSKYNNGWFWWVKEMPT